MIPVFPGFTILELSSRPDFLNIALRFPPYTEFNYTSAWAWNTKSATQVSTLNGNLVLYFDDVARGPSLSFIGDSKCDETIATLLEFTKQIGLLRRLQRVPEVSIANSTSERICLEEDRACFDYIYDTAEVAQFEGPRFSRNRSHVRKFIRESPNAYVTHVDLQLKYSASQVLTLAEEWLKSNPVLSGDAIAEREFLALRRLIDNNDQFPLTTIGVFVCEKLIAFSIVETTRASYGHCHFFKTDRRYIGLHDFLLMETAKFFVKKNIDFLNFEDDLGLPSLRYSKFARHPAHFLRKFAVRSN